MVSSAIYSRIDPSSIAAFSPTVIGTMLRGDLGFQGVVMSDSLGAAALNGTPVADRAVRFLAAGGTVALSSESGIVPAMVDGVLNKARSDSAFAATVAAAAQRVVEAKFDAGLVTCPDAAGAIAEHYAQLGGSSSALGSPVGDVQPVAGGAVQNYRNGAIFWSSATGARSVDGRDPAALPATGRSGRHPRLPRHRRHRHPGRRRPLQPLQPPRRGLHLLDAVHRRPRDLRRHPRPLGRPRLGTQPARLPHHRRTRHSRRRRPLQPLRRHEWRLVHLLDAVHGRPRRLRRHPRPLGGSRLGARPAGLPHHRRARHPDGVGRYNHFSRPGGASIYWTPSTGAHAIYGAIRAHWAALGWERGPLGYPTTDELGTPDGVGRYNHFTGSGGGSIYWTPQLGAHAVYGAIRDQWAAQGWERGPLGYPTTDVYTAGGRRRCDFQGGSLTA